MQHLNTSQSEYDPILPSYWFGRLDARPFSLFRIAFGLVLLKVAFYNLQVAEMFYSNAGIYPLELMHAIESRTRFSLMDALHHTWMVQAFFIIWMGVALALTLGYRSRLMTWLNFIIVLSVLERTPLINNGADAMIRAISFWIMFVPLGEYYSIDALQKRWRGFFAGRSLQTLRPSLQRTVFAFPVRMLQIQIALIYLFSFLLKLPGEKWWNGSALHYTLQIQDYTLPTGDWALQNMPSVILTLLTHSTMIFEVLFVFCIFLPYRQPYLRYIALASGYAFHIGIALVMSVPNFSAVMMTSYFIFYPSSLVRWLEGQTKRGSGHLTLPMPDDNSPLWWAAALIGDSHLMLDEETAQTSPDYDGWVIRQDSLEMSGVAAWQAVAGQLLFGRVWARLVALRRVRQTLWGLGKLALPVGNKTPAQTEPPPPTRALMLGSYAYRTSVVVLCGFFMVIVLWVNISGIRRDGERLIEYPSDNYYQLVRGMGFTQYWGMFAPNPRNFALTISADATYPDGRQVDLFTGEAPSDEFHRWLWGPQARWKKYIERVRIYDDARVYTALADYLCWQNPGVSQLEIYFTLVFPYGPDAPPLERVEHQQVWSGGCAGS